MVLVSNIVTFYPLLFLVCILFSVGVCICEWMSVWVWFSFTLLLFWGFLHLYIIHCVVWQCLSYAGILQSISGSFFCGCESNRGTCMGFCFSCRPMLFIHVVGMVGDPSIHLNCPVSLYWVNEITHSSDWFAVVMWLFFQCVQIELVKLYSTTNFFRFCSSLVSGSA